MTLLRKFSAKSVCLALALVVSVGTACATEIRVHVPLAAQWGGKMLPAGDYKFIYDNMSPFARLSGNGTEVSILVRSLVPRPLGEHAYLRIINVQGKPTVSALISGGQGLTYEFATPRATPKRAMTLAAAQPGGGS